MKRLLPFLFLFTGCTSIKVPPSAMFPGITYDNRVFNKTVSNLEISTTVSGTNGISTNLTVRVIGWKSEAQYVADAMMQAFVAGITAAKRIP
jgi:hypothetical protein